MLFSDRKNLLSLYNAVSGSHYDDPEKLEIITLENAIYMGMKNDLAFVLEMGLYLYEHQSTYNPNIPLRDLFYIASEYQALADGKSLYSSGIQKIPTPKFLVFYNGLDHKVPDRMELRLSDAYENPVDEPDLELKVTMLNINAGHKKRWSAIGRKGPAASPTRIAPKRSASSVWLPMCREPLILWKHARDSARFCWEPARGTTAS